MYVKVEIGSNLLESPSFDGLQNFSSFFKKSFSILIPPYREGFVDNQSSNNIVSNIKFDQDRVKYANF